MIRERMTEGFMQNAELSKIDRLLPDENTLKSISNFYSLFADSTRVKIISALAINEMCVTDLAILLSTHQSTISHQLKLLRSYGIVDYRREGKMIFYYISNLLIDDVMSIGIENMRNKVMNVY